MNTNETQGDTSNLLTAGFFIPNESMTIILLLIFTIFFLDFFNKLLLNNILSGLFFKKFHKICPSRFIRFCHSTSKWENLSLVSFMDKKNPEKSRKNRYFTAQNFSVYLFIFHVVYVVYWYEIYWCKKYPFGKCDFKASGVGTIVLSFPKQRIQNLWFEKYFSVH